MNSRQISCFLEAARCKSFSKAAQHLYISQPSFSRNIAQLEKELGLVLFARNSFHGIDLTESGKIMQEAFLSTLSEVDAAIERAHDLELTQSLHVTLGLLEGQLLDASLEDALSRFRLECPNATVDIRRDTYRQLMAALRDADVDLVCMPEWQFHDTDTLVVTPHAPIETVLVAPKRLAPKPEDRVYALAEFSELPFVSVTERGPQPIEDMLGELFASVGIDPPVIHAKNLREQIQKVEMGEGAILINPYNYICYSPNIRCFHVRELVPQPFSFAWRKDDTPEAINLLHPFLSASDNS